MSNIISKISFLHNARPYISADEYTNISASFPVGALPNTGDIIQLAGISHPMGAFFVSHRVFEVQQGSLYAVTLMDNLAITTSPERLAEIREDWQRVLFSMTEELARRKSSLAD